MDLPRHRPPPSMPQALNPRQHLLARLLSTLEPARRLSAADRLRLADHTRPSLLREGERLPAPSEKGWVTYLVGGRLRLFGEQGAQTVEQGSPRAEQPLFRSYSPQLRVVAETDCRLLRVETAVLQRLVRAHAASHRPGTAAAETRVGDLFQLVYRTYRRGELPLPSLPDIADKIRRAVDDPFVGNTEVAMIISTDPVLAARVIATVNSVFYRGHRPISSLREAVGRIGLVAIRNVTTAFTLRHLFEARQAQTQALMHRLYNHSIRVSALSHVIARRLKGFDPERALLAGLVHDIGLIPLLRFFDEHPVPPHAAGEAERVLRLLRGMAGNMVLSHLRFDEGLIAVAEGAEDWLRDPAPTPDLCDLVLIAQAHSFFGTPALARVPPLPQLPAFRKLDLGEVDPRVGLRFLHEARDEIRAIQELLGG